MTDPDSGVSDTAPALEVVDPPQLELRGLRKEYPGIVACADVDLRVRAGEIHAILGENGAGKSTLVKMIYGVTRPTAGQIFWTGREMRVENPAQARALGIGMVFQHFSLFETLTVAQNVALALPGRVRFRELSGSIREVSEHYGLPVDPARPVGSLSVGERQRVEIVRCLLQKPRLLIMDEPTSVLTPQAVERLFETLRLLAAEGCSILYISHKLDEIQSLCDEATVLRAGRVTARCQPAKETPASLARMMIGRDLPVCSRQTRDRSGRSALAIRNLSLRPEDPFGTVLRNISLDVEAGEIVGIAGISGNGQIELMQAIAGELTLSQADTIRIGDRPVAKMSPVQRRRLGMAFVPEERLGRGAVPDFTLSENAMLTRAWTRQVARFGMIRFGKVREFARRCIEGFNVQCSGTEAVARSLSGGNLQKFIVGRELLQEPSLVVCAQPTWGVDVGAAAFIRQSLLDLRDRGSAILVISEELEELLEISDRIGVLAGGELSPVLPVAETSAEQIGLWMSGMWPGRSPLDAGQDGKAQDRVAHA